MKKYTKKVSLTYFKKIKEISIENSINKIVYLEVNSPLNYGVKTFSYFGKIVKVTKCYFDILEYCTADIDNCSTQQILMKENNKRVKKWSKKSIRKLIEVSTDEKEEFVEYSRT